MELWSLEPRQPMGGPQVTAGSAGQDIRIEIQTVFMMISSTQSILFSPRFKFYKQYFLFHCWANRRGVSCRTLVGEAICVNSSELGGTGSSHSLVFYSNTLRSHCKQWLLTQSQPHLFSNRSLLQDSPCSTTEDRFPWSL